MQEGENIDVSGKGKCRWTTRGPAMLAAMVSQSLLCNSIYRPPEIRDAEEEEEQEEEESARIWRQTRVNQTAAATTASSCLRCVACSLASDRPSDLHLKYNYIASSTLYCSCEVVFKRIFG